MPAPQLLINSIPIAAGIAGKYCFFKKLGFEKDYVAGVLEGIKTVKKTRKVPYRKENFHNYLAIEWELIYGAALYIYGFPDARSGKKWPDRRKVKRNLIFRSRKFVYNRYDSIILPGDYPEMGSRQDPLLFW